MKKILVPTDFSKEASYAMEVATEIARFNNAQIILLHIVEAPFSGSFNTTGEYQLKTEEDVYILKLVQKAKSELNQITQHSSYEGLDIAIKIRVGNPFKGIAEEIAASNANLIVMGSKGATGIDELLVGSNAEKVVRLSPCPVLTVKSKPKNFKIREIVFASEFGDESSSILQLKELQELFFARLHLLYVNTSASFLPTEAIHERMKRFAELNKLDNYTFNIYNSFTEEEGITRFAESINADIISMATHGRRGILHFLMGSITEDILNHTKSMMFTFHLGQKTA